jgi:DUF1680 family protein
MGVSRRRFLRGGVVAAGGVVVGASPAGAMVDAVGMPGLRSGERMANGPALMYRAYRSKAASTADVVSWVQIDLERVVAIDAVMLYPANDKFVKGRDQAFGGEGFPVRFKVEAARTEDFGAPVTILDHTGADFENPGDAILRVPGRRVRGRYVRLTVTRFPTQPCDRTRTNTSAPESLCDVAGSYWFKVGKIGVLAGGVDVALGRRVLGDEVYGNPGDYGQVTRGERVEGEVIRRDRPWMVTDASTWKRVKDKAWAPRGGVTLQDGLFRTAMVDNVGYLMDSYTVDDLLLQFRQRAGKPVPAMTRKPNAFWEQDLAGSNAGRFLMGAGNTLRWMEDADLRARMDAVVDGIAECAEPDGYVMAFPEDTMFFSERGAYTRAWLTHGLIEAGYGGNGKAFGLMRRHADWFNECEYLPDLLRGAVQGGQGMIASSRMYFTPVGKAKDMQVLQRYFLEDRWLDALAKGDELAVWQYGYDRPHCYLLTNLEAYMDLYKATGEKRWLDGVRGGWELYNRHWEQAGGSMSIIEFIYAPPDSQQLKPRLGELCGSSFWVFLTQRFQMMEPDNEKYAAEIEKSIYNVALAAQDGTKGLRYHALLVGKKEGATRGNTCCEGQGTRLIGSLPEHVYSLAGDGVYVNLFAASTIAWEHMGEKVELRQETRFPFDGAVKLTVSAGRPVRMKVRVRVPGWAAGAVEVSVNGGKGVVGTPGTFLVLDREWREGDVVSFSLPMGFRVMEYGGTEQIAEKKRYSVEYGPLLYAVVGGTELKAAGGVGELAKRFVAEGEPLHFGVAGNEGVKLVPYWMVKGEAFTCFPVVEG